MKKIFLLILMVSFLSSFAQNTSGIIVTLQKQSISALLTEDNNNKQIDVDSKVKPAEKITILNPDWQKEKDWNRSFQLVDASDNALIKMNMGSQGSTLLSVKQLRAALKKGQAYSLYTIAIPSDPDVAARVRVRRILVCKINMK